MPTDKRKTTETIKDAKSLSGIGLGYKEEGFLFVMDYICKVGNTKKSDKFAVTFSPESMQTIIKALFECGKAYQKEFGKDIGFADVEEE